MRALQPYYRPQFNGKFITGGLPHLSDKACAWIESHFKRIAVLQSEYINSDGLSLEQLHGKLALVKNQAERISAEESLRDAEAEAQNYIAYQSLANKLRNDEDWWQLCNAQTTAAARCAVIELSKRYHLQLAWIELSAATLLELGVLYEQLKDFYSRALRKLTAEFVGLPQQEMVLYFSHLNRQLDVLNQSLPEIEETLLNRLEAGAQQGQPLLDQPFVQLRSQFNKDHLIWPPAWKLPAKEMQMTAITFTNSLACLLYSQSADIRRRAQKLRWLQPRHPFPLKMVQLKNKYLLVPRPLARRVPAARRATIFRGHNFRHDFFLNKTALLLELSALPALFNPVKKCSDLLEDDAFYKKLLQLKHQLETEQHNAAHLMPSFLNIGRWGQRRFLKDWQHLMLERQQALLSLQIKTILQWQPSHYPLSHHILNEPHYTPEVRRQLRGAMQVCAEQLRDIEKQFKNNKANQTLKKALLKVEDELVKIFDKDEQLASLNTSGKQKKYFTEQEAVDYLTAINNLSNAPKPAYDAVITYYHALATSQRKCAFIRKEKFLLDQLTQRLIVGLQNAFLYIQAPNTSALPDLVQLQQFYSLLHRLEYLETHETWNSVRHEIGEEYKLYLAHRLQLPIEEQAQQRAILLHFERQLLPMFSLLHQHQLNKMIEQRETTLKAYATEQTELTQAKQPSLKAQQYALGLDAADQAKLVEEITLAGEKEVHQQEQTIRLRRTSVY